MTADDGLLVGLVSSPVRVEARLVEWTPFGRLRASRRRLVEDVPAPSGFSPAPVQRQLAGVDAVPLEEQAAESWLQALASSVEQLLFGLRGPGVRLGVALDGWLDARGQHVRAAGGGPRVNDLPARLTNALRARSLPLLEPVRAVATAARAAALGEVWSPLGAMAGGVGGLVIRWDEHLSWADVALGRVVQEGVELPGAALDLGRGALARRWGALAADEGGLVRAIDRGDPRAVALAEESARGLGRAAGRRLLERLQRASGRPPGAAGPGGAEGVVVTGCLAGLLERPTVTSSFEHGLVERLSDREDASMSAGWLERRDGRLAAREGLVRVGRTAAGLAVGAAACCMQDRLPMDAPGGGRGSEEL